MNNFYIIEVGSHHGDFLILPEKILIIKGIISSGNNNGTRFLSIYPYDYTKRNWTSDKQYWVSTLNSPLSDMDHGNSVMKQFLPKAF